MLEMFFKVFCAKSAVRMTAHIILYILIFHIHNRSLLNFGTQVWVLHSLLNHKKLLLSQIAKTSAKENE